MILDGDWSRVPKPKPMPSSSSDCSKREDSSPTPENPDHLWTGPALWRCASCPLRSGLDEACSSARSRTLVRVTLARTPRGINQERWRQQETQSAARAPLARRTHFLSAALIWHVLRKQVLVCHMLPDTCTHNPPGVGSQS